ncbi:MAG: oligopeptide/dipeptide ABC transporter ATP-binding protein [Evtepia gabavorous]
MRLCLCDVRGTDCGGGGDLCPLPGPRHPYTQGLLKAIPSLEGTADRLYTIRGSVPDPRCPLPGCRFCPRCDQSRQDCARQVPDLRALAAGHWVRCCHIS